MKWSFVQCIQILLIGLSSISVGFTQSASDNQLLWKLTRKGSKKVSYLYGTFHSNDPRVFRFSDSVYAALEKSSTYVLEENIYIMFCQIDTRIKKTTMRCDASCNPFTLNRNASKTRYGDENGRPQFLDLYFQLLALNSNKKCVPLESIEGQLSILEIINEKNKTPLQTLEKINEEKILQTYLDGNIESIRLLTERQLAGKKEAYQLLINERNFIMADGLDTLFRKENCFAAIGAAHLSGPDGVLQLLKERGYRLQLIPPSYNAITSDPNLFTNKYNQYIYRDSTIGIALPFGGKPYLQDESYSKEIIYQEMGQGNTYLVEIEKVPANYQLSSYIESIFNTPEKAKIQRLKFSQGIEAYEGIAQLFGIGDAWRRVFIHRNYLIKLTCYGGNKFMNSDRSQRFFNRVLLF